MRKVILFLVTISMVSCWDNVEDIAESGSAIPPSLTIVVTDNDTGEPVSGATVELYSNQNDYIYDQNLFASGSTGSDGKFTFDKSQLGNTATRFYFTVKAGAKRNWAFTTSTSGVMTLTNGATEVLTKVDDVLPQFISLSGGRFALTSYTYPGWGNILDPDSGYGLDACRTDDEFLFLKTGRIIGFDDGLACTPSHPKGYTVAGFDWSSWSLPAADAGASINMKDVDPDWYTGGALNNYTAVLSISGDENTVTIDYGGGYVATLVRVN